MSDEERLRLRIADAIKMLKNVEECPREGNRLYCVACAESIDVARGILEDALIVEVTE